MLPRGTRDRSVSCYFDTFEIGGLRMKSKGDSDLSPPPPMLFLAFVKMASNFPHSMVIVKSACCMVRSSITVVALLYEFSVIITFQHLHLLNGNLIQLYQSLALGQALVDEHGIEILHIRQAD